MTFGRVNLSTFILGFGLMLLSQQVWAQDGAFDPISRDQLDDAIGKDEVDRIFGEARDKAFCGNLRDFFISVSDARESGVPRNVIEKLVDLPADKTDNVSMLFFSSQMNIVEMVYQYDPVAGVARQQAATRLYDQCMEKLPEALT
ncbi:hypothetical protein ACEUZ9_005444 [Paracoccus litorisediminis]|uniref:hypothetical protein n=1 Tax=Paracoccus litorisediminis TaxID=2006130 RepID=UPI003731ADA5